MLREVEGKAPPHRSYKETNRIVGRNKVVHGCVYSWSGKAGYVGCTCRLKLSLVPHQSQNGQVCSERGCGRASIADGCKGTALDVSPHARQSMVPEQECRDMMMVNFKPHRVLPVDRQNGMVSGGPLRRMQVAVDR